MSSSHTWVFFVGLLCIAIFCFVYFNPMNYKFIWSKNKSSNTPSNGSSPNAPSGGSSPNAPSQSDTLSLVPFESFVGNVLFIFSLNLF